MPPYPTPDAVEAVQRRQLWGAAAFIVLAVSMANLPAAAQEVVASSLRATLLRPFLGLQSAVVGARVRAAEVERLQARLDSATARLMAGSTVAEENRRLRGLLDLSARIGPGWQAAGVIRPGTQGSESIFILDRGIEDGIRQWAPVVTREGLAGMVREVQRRSAVGMDWTHPDFRASAMSEDGTVYGFVEPRRGMFREQDRLLFTNTPFSTRLDSGTVVLTSGVGGVFPRGIAVGRIVEEAEAEGGWRTSYWLEPYVQPGDLVHVLVARGPATGARTDTASSETPAERRVGGGAVPGPDVGAAWPPELRGTRAELDLRMDVALDSLALMRSRVEALRDSLEAARAVRTAPGDTSRPGVGGGGR